MYTEAAATAVEISVRNPNERKKMLRHKEPPSRREEKKTRFNQSKHSPASESRTTTLDSREFEMFTCWLRCALFTVNGKSNYRYYFLPPIWLRVEFWEFCSVDSTAMRSRFSLFYSNNEAALPTGESDDELGMFFSFAIRLRLGDESSRSSFLLHFLSHLVISLMHCPFLSPVSSAHGILGPARDL